MDVVVKNIEKTRLDLPAFLFLVKEYCNSFKYDVRISFDSRLRCAGNYIFDRKASTHIIKISPLFCSRICVGSKISKDKRKIAYSLKRLDKNGEKHELVATAMHELRHAQQRECMGADFEQNDRFNNKFDIKNEEYSIFYSSCEIDARIFENQNVTDAVSIYDKACKQSKKVLK